MAIARLQQPTVQVMIPAEAQATFGMAAPAGTDTVRSAASTTEVAPSAITLVSAIIAVAVALALACRLSSEMWDPGALDVPKVAAGLSIFAFFYATAQAVERLLEPFTMFILPTAKAAKKRDEKVAEFQNANTALKGQAAATAQADLDIRRANRTVAFWALATILGMAASAWLKLYFLRLLGLEAAPRVAEILFTGLVIGGGTKPLHDLIARLEKAKTNAEDPPETRSGSPG